MLMFEIASCEFASREFAFAFAAQRLDCSGQDQTIITWNVSPNRPGCKPDMVYRSCAMHHLRNVPGCYPVWYVAAIHGGPYQEWEI